MDAGERFTEAWQLDDATMNALRSRIKSFIMRDLLGPSAENLEPDWTRSTYPDALKYTDRIFKTQCKNFGSVNWVFPVASRVSQAALNAHVTTLNFSPELVARIQRCQTLGKKTIACVPIIMIWSQTASHIALLFFDLKRNLTWLYDPGDSLSKNASFHTAFSTKAFVPGFDPVPAHLIGHQAQNHTLQTRFETDNNHQQGICGLMVILIRIVCLRFNYFDTKMVSRLIRQCLTPAQAQEVIRKLVTFYETDLMVGRINIYDLYVSLTRNHSGGNCCVFSASTHRLCKRKPCKGLQDNDHNNRFGVASSFCWQHRALGTLQYTSKKCNADSDIDEIHMLDFDDEEL